MLVILLLKMWCVLTLCPIFLVSGAQTLSIDSQLGTSIEDCFERISIGEQLPPSAIYRNVSELTTRECEQICKQDKQCQTYDYGVGAKGNATCELSNLGEKELKEKKILLRHPDYDIYVRRFQCEQTPPTPLQPQEDEAQEPQHRPVFRPEVEDPKRPLSDEYLPDLRPFESIRPDNYRPYPPLNSYKPKPPYLNHIDRPDDYNQRPSFDVPPSYGVHRPQDIPYRPERPHNYSDPYDVLQFQGERPHYGSWRPDPHYPLRPYDDIPDLYGQKPVRPYRPELPPYRPEQPEFVYINRPNRKPLRPQEDTGVPGYGNKPSRPLDYSTKPDPYAPNDDPRPPYKPSRPVEYPYSPYERPSYDYNSQYASNYGQNQYNNDNSIYVEIYDPPRPYKPSKPTNDRPIYSNTGGYGQSYGYGSQSDFINGGNYNSQNVYQSQSNHYGSGTITQLDNYNRPQDHRPYKPQTSTSSGYGVEDSRPEKPYDRPNSGYGSQVQDPIGTSGYGSLHIQDPIGYKPQKPTYESSPSYGRPPSNSYGSSQSSSESLNYGSSHSSHDQSYGSHSSGDVYQSSYKPQAYPKPTYEKPSYSQPTSNQGPYGTQTSYGSGQNNYGTSQSYGGTHSINQDYNSQSSYGSQTYGGYQESYGNNRPLKDPKPYGDNRPSYGERPQRPSYSERPQYDDQSSYGNRPHNDRPIYDSRPSYDKPLYGEKPYEDEPPYQKPSQDKPGYGQRPIYDNKPYEKPAYDKPAYDTPAYDKPSSDNGPSYDNNRPDGELGPDLANDGYKNNVKNQTASNTYTDNRPDVKPVYEYELEKPSNVPSYIVRPNGEVITSRPVTIGDYGDKPSYGREPVVSYKACFRRVLAGKRALRSFVRRVVPCERLEDCRRECAEERRFHCESFNYRLDPSFRGKGLCEMMTKPIEAFNIRRDFVEDKDYDFYELDRNSLEPHCPETLRGPGMLHSGFLGSKGSYNSWDRNDYSDRGYDRNRFDERRPVQTYGGRRQYEDQFYVPYQIGMGRSNDDHEIWGQYGGSYGNSYYKDRNDYHKSISHWGLNDLEPPPPMYGVRPISTENFNYRDLGKKTDRYGYGAWKRGRWNTSGSSPNGLDYGESNYFKPPPRKHVYYEPADRSSEERSDEVVAKDCSSRRRPGMSLGSGAVRRSLYARNVVQCETACFDEREFKCVSYSYRYSNSHGSDNCFLSERPYRGLELSADSGSDVYAMPENQGCSVSYKPFIESECFWHVRSGAAVSGTAVRAQLTVAGLGACEAECIRAHAFFCRGFSFRFDSPTIGDDLENCILTSTPPTSLETGRGLRPNAGHELYARGNYGRGCEPALYDDVHTTHKESGECYLQYDNAAKLIGTAIKGSAKVPDERSCGKACTDAPFRCLSFSYNNVAPPDIDNCLLSEIRLFDLQRGVDYEHSTDDWLFAFDLFNGQCWRKVHGREKYDQPVAELPRPLSPSGSGPSGPSSSGHSGPSGPTGTGYLPAPASPAAPSYIPESGPTGSGYKPYPEPRPEFKPSYPGPGYLPAEPPGYLPRPSGPGYVEPSGSYRPSAPSGLRPSGTGYLPTGSGPGYSPTGPYRPSGPPSGPPRPIRPEYPETGYGLPGPAVPPVVFRPGPQVQYGPPGPTGTYGPIGPPGPIKPLPPREEEPIAASWRHYTVSGYPCRQGTLCAQNRIAGHWSCEPEGGEYGSWDYCCAPTHRCGYSEGFNKPWCYVGPSTDQWRPCSEKYYPYHQHNIPHPSQGTRGPERPRPVPGRPLGSFERPDLSYLPEADRRYWEDLYNNGPQAYYDKYGNPLPGYTRVPTAERPHIKYQHNYPRPGSGIWVPVQHVPAELDPPVPGGLGVPRYWPVAYLHKGPPPNTTYFRYNQTERPPSTTEKYDQPSPTRANSRDPARGFSREPSRDYSREPSRDFSREPSRDLSREHPRDFSREPSRDFTRDPSREPTRDSNREFSRDPSRDFSRDPTSTRDTPREPSDFNRDLSRDLPREPSREPDGDSSRDPSRDRNLPRERPIPSFAKINPDSPLNNNIDNKNHRDEKTRNITNANEDIFNTDADTTSTTTPKVETKAVEEVKVDNTSTVETYKSDDKSTEKVDTDKELDNLKGIDDKLDDFSKSIEVLDIEDAKKGEKLADLKTLEAEERQIEAIGRLLASRRGQQLVLEKRSQKDLEAKNIALDEDLVNFNFRNKFPTTSNVERRGTVQRVTKDEIVRERLMDKSLEVSETTFVRPPRVLSTTENIRKAIVNGKIFYSANIRDQRDLANSTLSRKDPHNSAFSRKDLLSNSTRKAKSLRPLEERAPSIISNANYGKKKVIRARNVNPVRKVRRVYRRKYNPDEVRRRLLERERSMKENAGGKKL